MQSKQMFVTAVCDLNHFQVPAVYLLLQKCNFFCQNVFFFTLSQLNACKVTSFLEFERSINPFT